MTPPPAWWSTARSSPPRRKNASPASSTIIISRERGRYCLSEAGITANDLDYVGFYDKPLLKFDRLLETYLDYAPAGFRSFLKAMPLWLKEKLWMPDLIRTEMASRLRHRRASRGQKSREEIRMAAALRRSS
jgi:predicted NodU family carbamoyl transferase